MDHLFGLPVYTGHSIASSDSYIKLITSGLAKAFVLERHPASVEKLQITHSLRIPDLLFPWLIILY